MGAWGRDVMLVVGAGVCEGWRDGGGGEGREVNQGSVMRRNEGKMSVGQECGLGNSSFREWAAAIVCVAASCFLQM